MTTKETLQRNNIRPTRVRLAVVKLLEKSSYALSHADFENEIGREFNRVTLYRTLHTLEENSIIHKVVDADGISKFMLSSVETAENSEEHEHVHFKCKHCGHLFCFNTTENLQLHLPKGFSLKEIVINAEGLCDRCSH